jgi:hypothetical protein
MKRYAGGVLFALVAAITVGWLFMSRSGNGDGAEPPRERDGFAADRAGGAGPNFDGDRAMGYLKDVCKLGTRISGSAGMTKQQELLKKHFEDLGATVEFQRFTARQRSHKEPVEMANMIVSWFPERARRVILCSHYDTRPIADQEPKRRDWERPFISANDGGSGVALLMELGNQMRKLETAVGVDFVFFDGEEYIFNPGDGFGDDGDKYFFGSEHFAQQYAKNRPKHRYVGAVLFDMIGGKNPSFPVEQNSWISAGGLVQTLWKIADEQKCGAFKAEMQGRVNDDHLALNRAGIPAVDIIDFSYPHWHRLSDTPENCSAEGLGQVARVVQVWLTRVR